ncbi:CPBP family intramembrane glutamic endopeptidase [Leptospira ryugenii]|uniref:CPBP family intramembrane glutamic endopeptidase n=1 Tax=Leptospira ryugenii TaxID=1917863 RepID=UPI000D595E6F
MRGSMQQMIKNFNKNAKSILILIFCTYHIPLFIDGFDIAHNLVNYIPSWIVGLVTSIIIPIIGLIYITYIKEIITRYHLGFHNLIFHKRNYSVIFYTSIFFSFFIFLISFELHELTIYIFQENLFKNYTKTGMEGISLPFALFYTLYLSLRAGIFEEVFYRGLLRIIIKNDYSFNFTYIFLSSALFASIHWGDGIRNILVTFFLGIIWAISYLNFKSIWPNIISHTSWDIYAISNPYNGYLFLTFYIFVLSILILFYNFFTKKRIY